MQKHLFIVLLFGSIFSFSQDCDYSFSGNVIDFHDGTPLVGATIAIAETNIVALAGFDGEFSLSNVCKVNVLTLVTYCDSKSFNVTISGNTIKTFKLEHIQKSSMKFLYALF